MKEQIYKDIKIIFLALMVWMCFIISSCGSDETKVKTNISVKPVNMDIELIEGETQKLEYISNGDKFDTNMIEYKTSDGMIATVDEKGNVLAVKKGRVIVSAVYDDETICNWIISVYKEIKIDSEKTDIDIIEGDVIRLLYNVSGGLPDEEKKVSFSVSDEEIVSVSDDGYVRAVKPGNTKIVACVEEEKIEWNVTVYEGYKVIAKKSVIKIEKDDANDLSKIVSFSGGIPNQEARLSFESENKKICSVDDNGKILGKKPGKTKIKIACENSKPLYIAVTVLPKAYIKSKVKEYTNHYEGESFKLQYVIGGGDKSYKVKFTSEDKKIATVSKDGVVKCLKPGATKIKGKYGDSVFTWKIKVKSKTVIMELKDGSYSIYGGYYSSTRYIDYMNKRIKDREYLSYEITSNGWEIEWDSSCKEYNWEESKYGKYTDVFSAAVANNPDRNDWENAHINMSVKDGFVCINTGKLIYKIKFAKNVYIKGGEYPDPYREYWDKYKASEITSSMVRTCYFCGFDIKNNEIICILMSP